MGGIDPTYVLNNLLRATIDPTYGGGLCPLEQLGAYPFWHLMPKRGVLGFYLDVIGVVKNFIM
jgi:hypothetical protein